MSHRDGFLTYTVENADDNFAQADAEAANNDKDDE